MSRTDRRTPRRVSAASPRRQAALLTVAVLLGAGAITSPLAAQDHARAPADDDEPTLEEWTVPWENTRPRDPFVGPDGTVWFVGQQGDYVGALDPASGDFRRYDLPAGAGPHNLVVAPDGTVWYTGNRARHLGRLDPATGDIEPFELPDERARDPHTLVFDRQGGLWFTVQGGNFVGHFDPSTGDFRLIEAPQVEGSRRGSSSRPYGIKMDSHDRPWVALFNTNALAMVDPATYELVVHRLPDERSRPRRLVIDSQDRIWYVDYALGQLGRFDPATGEVKEWPNPSGPGSRPYGVEIDDADRVWFVETGPDPNVFVGFDTRTEKVISAVPVPSGGGTIRHMFFDARTNSI
ncbi:MAG: hypothetical protein D6701_02540, partial [Gemmatimonadetes bacterium]